MSYPANSATFESGTACQWVLEAPEGREVILEITKLNLPPPFENGTCPALVIEVIFALATFMETLFWNEPFHILKLDKFPFKDVLGADYMKEIGPLSDHTKIKPFLHSAL